LGLFLYFLKWEYAFLLQVWGYVPKESDCLELGIVTKWEMLDALIDVVFKIIIEFDW
jgi:hypothetical protein